jgi:hypothetical protein
MSGLVRGTSVMLSMKLLVSLLGSPLMNAIVVEADAAVNKREPELFPVERRQPGAIGVGRRVDLRPVDLHEHSARDAEDVRTAAGRRPRRFREPARSRPRPPPAWRDERP